jgi:hypothetical protein
MNNKFYYYIMLSSIEIFNIPEIKQIILEYKYEIDQIYSIILFLDDIIHSYSNN